jgi:hypothetical protein
LFGAGKTCPKKQGSKFQVRFELDGAGPRPRTGRRKRAFSFGTFQMESIRPSNTDPIPAQTSQHHVGIILIRFVGILIAAIAVMALLWSR